MKRTLLHRTVALLVGAALPAAAAHARQAATLAVSHNDPDGIVAPDETVRLTVSMSWTPASAVLWRVAGDVVASPNLGVASNPAIGLAFLPGAPISPEAILEPGTPSGGSVTGMEVFSSYFSPSGVIVLPPWNQSTNVALFEFDWTAPNAPGATVDFAWAPSPSLPSPELILNYAGGPVTSVPTTYSGTSLLIVPTPASLPIMCLGLAMAGSRRLRSRRLA